MDKQFLVNLTSELYRLTLLFPKKEPLRYKMREVADDILVDLLMPFPKKKKSLFEVLDGFFEVALVQNWVKSSDILAIKNEYVKIKENLLEIENNKAEPKKTDLMVKEKNWEIMPIANGNNKNNFSFLERQKKILEFIKENGRAQVWQIKQIFPDISKRTLRRDFEIMFKRGLLERIGERNNTFYQIKESASCFKVGQEVGK